MKLQKILNILLIALLVITVVFILGFYFQVVPMSSETEQMDASMTNGILGWAACLFIVCALVAVAFPIYEFIMQLISDPKSAKKTLYVAAAVVLVSVLAYYFSSGSMDSICDTLVPTDEQTLMWSGVGLNALYITLALSVCAVIYAEVAKNLK